MNDAGLTSRVSRRLLLGGAAGLAGLSGTTAWALNRYVIEHVDQTVTGDTATAEPTGTFTDESYTSAATSLTIEKVSTRSGSDAITYFVADITTSDSSLIRSAFAKDSFGTNIIENPSDIAAGKHAVLAVNGDYYGFRDTGIVIRNGVAYRDEGARQGLVLSRDGSMRLYDETTTTAQELIDAGAWQTLSFGPGLIRDGEVIDGIDSIEIDTNFGNHSIQGTQPRTAVGMVEAGHYLWIVVDGRSTGYSRGMTMPELAQVFLDRHATVAYNLDGGGSSAMVFNDELVNDPLGRGRERGTSDILYVAG
ncbi:phosphodiester glycosidase family protein [Micropruina sonneratiae]|uniref:phosphodiester glycosidase family protein n=1 Tax=Micropruina sonneratiae TaxID=2986940 RepID=UPI002226E1C2|nr:phosphodiester glycosidase family protein [Micropruina sp. KQZ13P-5]MCW3158868.1 phosphodiester glycosidase family protein [Micropruina sp. KQZ13P-5]